MRVWIGLVAFFVIAFIALRSLGVVISGEGSLLSLSLQGLAILIGVVSAGTLLRRQRASTRESSPDGVEAERNGAGYAAAVVASLVVGAFCSLWMAFEANYVGLTGLALVAIATILAFWVGRKVAS